jgi:hypothetical protein
VNRSFAQRFFPTPLVAVAILLVVMILLTPVLLSSSQPAPGSIEAEVELIVDYVSGGNAMHFYVRGLGASVRYADMTVRVASGFPWNAGVPTASGANWTLAVNETDVLAAIYSTGQNPVALNVTVLYSVPGASAYYIGVFAFDLGPSHPASSQDLLAVSTTPNVVVTASQPVSSLPEFIVLADVGSTP